VAYKKGETYILHFNMQTIMYLHGKPPIEDLSHKNPTLFKDLNFVFTLHINLRCYTAASVNFRRMQASKETKPAILKDMIH